MHGGRYTDGQTHIHVQADAETDRRTEAELTKQTVSRTEAGRESERYRETETERARDRERARERERNGEVERVGL